MRGGRLGRDEVDRLLREALHDDLAPAEEGRLRTAMRETWRSLGTHAVPATARPALRRGRAGSPGGARVALAACAGLLLVLGIGLQLAAPPRLVAASLLVRNESLWAARQMRRAVAMSCRLVVREAGAPQVYRIDWQAPGHLRVTAESARGSAEWAGTLGEGSVPENPTVQAAGAFLSPSRVEALLAGRWRPLPERSGAGESAFEIARGGERLRGSFDRSSGLPVRIEDGFEATLVWTLRDEEPLPLSAAARSGEGGAR